MMGKNIDLIVPRRLEDRPERYKRIVYKKIQDYIKNGSKGHLNLSHTPIENLPSNLKTVDGDLHLQFSKILELPEGIEIFGNLHIRYTPLSEKYNEEQIRKMIKDSGGFLFGMVYIVSLFQISFNDTLDLINNIVLIGI